MPGAAHDGGEDGAGSVIAGETGLAHAGATVYYKAGNFFITHREGSGVKEFKTRVRGRQLLRHETTRAATSSSHIIKVLGGKEVMTRLRGQQLLRHTSRGLWGAK